MTLETSLFSDRGTWMSVLATASPTLLSNCWKALPVRPDFTWIREPQFETVMLRARADAEGGCFNLGEMTVTRCSVQLEDGTVGVGCIGGRDKRHAAIAAVVDAMMLGPDGSWLESARNIVLSAQQADRISQSEVATKVRETEVSFSMSIAGVR
ncbi:phosphonate C-P lyase system protein PhnG [Rhizobium sp. 1AS11]|uniref:phosphonate C-P lyase system protein PhnG n=1 Tax=Rhizobium acaciae TaxID=2989736 RepID=UPI00222331C3|nr:phosphonate C-P lyase system protein PhnG [Rhizobium acaciae]MCW1412993.1 phosphonate C-P lyase system protein PhnG [Rhizobium acaciae]MCW1745145.1 phosphonate C-P lyase system protein PhnG [Rhizobium acaciae]